MRQGRKGDNARKYLSLFNLAYQVKRDAKLDVLTAMRFEGSNEGRGTVERSSVESVNATEVRVTARLKVRRNDPTANDLETMRDTERNYSIPRERVSECRSIIAPLWSLELGTSGAIKVAERSGRAWRVVEAPEREWKAKKASPSFTRSESRRMRLDAAAAAVTTRPVADYLSDAS